MSLDAPVVTKSGPLSISSAIRPPYKIESLLSKNSLVWL